MTGFPDRPPTRIGISIGDSLAALFATIGCLTALHERKKSGIGQVVDTAIYEAVFAMMEGLVPEYEMAGYVRERTGNILPGVAPANIYETKEGNYIALGANADNVFRRLAAAMGMPEIAEDERFSSHTARGQNMEELDTIVNEWTRTKSTEELLTLLGESGVPAGKIYNVKDIVEDPHYAAREMIISMQHPTLGNFRMPGIVPKLSRTPGEVKEVGAIRPGQHNDKIYKEILEYSDLEIHALNKMGVI